MISGLFDCTVQLNYNANNIHTSSLDSVVLAQLKKSEKERYVSEMNDNVIAPQNCRVSFHFNY